jgi:membrane protein DedA with SNARE-associated domain
MTAASLWAAVLAAGADVNPSPDPQVVGYPTVFLLVALGAIVPVIPTGAVVSAAAVVAWHAGPPYDLPLVFAFASVAALVGDTALYWLAKHGVGGPLRRLRARVDTPRLDATQRRLDEHGARVLVVSRLIPAGRIPVMAACLASGWSVRRFVRADVAAALAWAAGYLAIGALGASLFPEPWEALVAVIALAVLAGFAPTIWRWLRAAGRRIAPQHEDRTSG